jgi:glycosyltransferase involved in cell wall biosynthesis
LHGIGYILEAAKQLEEQTDIRFEFIGSGQTYHQMRTLSEELGLKNTQFFGSIPPDKVPSFMTEADSCLGIFGDTEKTQRVIPNKVYEALGMRKPVITCNSPAIREVFCDKRHLLLCKHADAHSLAQAILHLKHDDELRMNIAEHGYKSVKEHFTPAAIGKHFAALIESVI